ncbi:MAG: PSD1 and planctomycete cytochrome C domain-containing protein [Armatimonadota bacterium]
MKRSKSHPSRRHRALAALGVLLPGVAALAAAAAPDGPAVDFNRDVKPILAENCFACHGADGGKRMAGLRLDTLEGALHPAASGKKALVPGKPEESELLKRVVATDARVMPPAATGKKLTPAQIDTLRRWIAQGGKYADHWAYLPIQRPAVPKVKNAKWPLSTPDRFVLARLEKEGLKPSPEADRRTLIRRVSLDLTGLPPKPEEVEAFVADKSPDAYEKVVDRLLASPHYGERMAVYWLDLVRYADTVGYHGDQDYNIWPYRDYVIRSFNENKRFDQFTREQLAGDLLAGDAKPEPGSQARAQLVASGYNRLGMMSAEGGVQDKEYLAKYAAERVRNTSTVWMGSTLGCAECHDHKFDPFTAKDFYRFAAFFADLTEKGFYDGGYGRDDWGPSLKLPTPEQQSRLSQLDRELEEAKKALAAVSDEALAGGRGRWEQQVRALDAEKALGWKSPRPVELASSGGSTLEMLGDGSVLVKGELPARDTYQVELPVSGEITAVRLEAIPDGSLPGSAISRAGYYFVTSEIEVAVQNGSGAPQPLRLAAASANMADEGYPAYALIDGKPETGWAKVLPAGGSRVAVIQLEEPIRAAEGTRLVVRVKHDADPHKNIGRFRVSVTGVPGADVSPQALPDNVLAAIRKEPSARSADEAKLVAAHYRTVAPELEAARRRVHQLEGERSILTGVIPQTLVSKAREPRVMRVLPRGNWMDDSGEVVQPGAPEFLNPPAKQGRATRLDLANWLVSPENPLTARVLANRLWKLFYGIGPAKSLDDFGAQGEPPVHPELLDWLAGELIRSGWDVKQLVRRMVTTRTYRQRSDADPKLLARDPYNRLYARQSAVRLDAEFIRDVALSASGLLKREIGGPSVYPYQPAGYLAPLNFPTREWAADTGPALYRRALYTHWQRTFVHPSLLAFDAPTREECTAQRVVSNTPMQALVLLNDPIFVEASRVFAQRILREGGESLESRARFAFRTAVSRDPSAEELKIVRELYHNRRARYSADRKEAEKAIHVGEAPVDRELDPVELATWATIGRAILNLHETITRG